MNYLGLRDNDKVGIIEPFKGLVAIMGSLG